MQVDSAQLSRQLGVGMQHYSLSEFFDLVEGQDPQAVEDDVARVEAMGLPMEEGLARDDLVANSRYYLAMRALLDDEPLDALAVRCWPELPKRFGTWPYLAMARLAGENRAVALEGDVDGAISCLLGRLLGIGRGLHHRLAGTRRALDHALAPGPRPLGDVRGRLGPAGATLQQRVPPGVERHAGHGSTDHAFPPLAMRRRLPDDRVAAHTAPPRRELLGANGLAVVADRSVPDCFETLCHEGMPHHMTVFSGGAVDLLRRLARQVQVHWVEC